MKAKKSLLNNQFIPILISIVLGFLVGAVFLMIMGLSVGTAYGRLLNSVTSLKGFSYVVVYAVPYIVAGLSVAFRSRQAYLTSVRKDSSWSVPWRLRWSAFCLETFPSRF